jgi:predicted dehydrogenase/threonine dehydrogenase-like Zn-dependent dehydrogenase
MKQVLQSLRDGVTTVADVPRPLVRTGHVLVRSRASLISAGTERMLVSFGKAGWLAKARQQPDKVRMVLEKIRTDGVLPTLDAVRSKLDQPLALGYSNAGVVVEVGSGVEGLKPGDRVLTNGKHAEFVLVPKNLVVRIPDEVDFESACFGVVGAIALQGMRLAAPTLGETVVVVGLGLIGLLTVQILRASGCRVIGIDVDRRRCESAERYGATAVLAGDGVVDKVYALTGAQGADAVLVTASTTSSAPIGEAARMSRKRGRIVLVGVTGLELSRADFYEKELTFQVSCSYGPGRYDPIYEEKGQDYPLGFVRWTEQRNFAAVLDLMAWGRLTVKELISNKFSIERAVEAYELLASGSSLALVLEYPGDAKLAASTSVALPPVKAATGPVLGVIGTGAYASRVLLPAIRQTGAKLGPVASAMGMSAVHFGKKFGADTATSDWRTVMAEPTVNAVVIATRHDQHAELVCEALRHRKHVFVEKPLAMTHADLDQIAEEYAKAAASGFRPIVMVGFNRRYSPLVSGMKVALAAAAGPKAILMTINAGPIPREHWTQDRATGGGRVLGEGCHFIDLARHLVGASIVEARSDALRDAISGVEIDDCASLHLRFDDGSIATVHYLANGHKSFPKERIEVFAGGRVLQLDNFRELRAYGGTIGATRKRLWRQNKGNAECMAAFVAALRSGDTAALPSFEELCEVSRVTIDLARGLPSAEACAKVESARQPSTAQIPTSHTTSGAALHVGCESS